MRASPRFLPAFGVLLISPPSPAAADEYHDNGYDDSRSAIPPSDDPAALVRAFADEALDSPSGQAALRRWAARDREAALAWLESGKPLVRFALSATVERWGAVDPAGAARYLAACRDAVWRGRVVDALVLDALAGRRPRTALALLARFPGSAQEALLRETALAVLAELDPSASADPRDFDALLRPRAANADPDSSVLAEGTITLADFARLVGEGRAVVLDARTEAEHREACVPGALFWPAHDFEGAWLRHRAALEADRSRPIIVYCADGGCGASGVVWRELRRLGYARAVVFSEGWAAWLEAGSPVEAGCLRDAAAARAGGGNQDEGTSW